MFKWALQHDLLIVTGGDMFGPAYNTKQAEKMGTSNAAEVLSWSGGMNPYKYGELGVIKNGAYADLVLIDGNPLEDINILNDYDSKFKLIMKDGVIYKNTL